MVTTIDNTVEMKVVDLCVDTEAENESECNAYNVTNKRPKPIHQQTVEGNESNRHSNNHDDNNNSESIVTVDTSTEIMSLRECDDMFQNDKSFVVDIQSDLTQEQQPKLSKWIQRLLHPELRSKDDETVIQYPEIIPLNDTYIQDFGRRVRDDEITYGIQPLDIEHDIIDVDAQNDIVATSSSPSNEAQSTNTLDIPAVPPTSKNKKLPRKVKITNIKYTTTASTIEETLEQEFGPIEFMNLIMQQDSTSSKDTKELNSGLAYVTFVDPESAERCEKNLKMLDKRPVSASIIPLHSGISSTSMGGSTAASRRYWSEVDLSIKCYTCGQVGHMSYECTASTSNPTTTVTMNGITTTTHATTLKGKPRKPCPLCANTSDHSEIYQCPFRNVCFNCGIPGHISRECPNTQQGRGIKNNYQQSQQQQYNNNSISRCICTICYKMNHHTKHACPWLMSNSTRNHGAIVHPSMSAISSDAMCLSCGKKGHFLCNELKWFYGLKGVSCSNWYVQLQ
jgi:cellular nucleic acid-binding protein